MHVSMLEANNRLSRLVKAAQAGEEVIIANHGVPAVRLVPTREPRRTGGLGSLKRIQPSWTQPSRPRSRRRSLPICLVRDDPRLSIRPAHAFGSLLPKGDRSASRCSFPAYAGLARP